MMSKVACCAVSPRWPATPFALPEHPAHPVQRASQQKLILSPLSWFWIGCVVSVNVSKAKVKKGVCICGVLGLTVSEADLDRDVLALRQGRA